MERPTITNSSRVTNDGTIAEETGTTTAAVVVADEMRETTIVMDAEAIARETTIGEDAEVGLPIRRPLIDWQTAEIIEEAGTTIAVVVVGETTIVGMLAEAVEEEMIGMDAVAVEEETVAVMVVVGVVDLEAEEIAVTVPRGTEGRETNTKIKGKSKTLYP